MRKEGNINLDTTVLPPPQVSDNTRMTEITRCTCFKEEHKRKLGEGNP